MSSGFYICNKCTEVKPPGKRFKVPADEIGVALMTSHLWDEHQINIAHRKAQTVEQDGWLD